MKHRKPLSALLAAALTLSLCGGAVIATQTSSDVDTLPQEQLLIAPAPAPAIPNQSPSQPSEQNNSEPLQTSPTPDPDGTVSFGNVAQRVLEGNLNARALGSSIAALEAMDYNALSDELRSVLNPLATLTFAMYCVPNGMGSTAASSLQQSYDALSVQFDAIHNGDLEQQNTDTLLMLKNTRNQMAMAGESLYITLVELQQNGDTLQRNLDTLERGLAELSIRHEMGQVSSLTLQETQSTKNSLLSTQQTLLNNYSILIYQLQSLLGAELTGQLTLAPLPAVTQAQLDEMDLESDLKKAKEVSYTLHEAKRALEDARDEYRIDASYHPSPSKNAYKYEMAYHQWNAAQRTYEAAVQNFELGLRTLYHQVMDYQQVLNTAKSTLSVKQSSLAAAQIKYEQGAISKFDLLDAQDTVAAAQDTVNSAAIDLFSTYTNYRWAVDYGILN